MGEVSKRTPEEIEREIANTRDDLALTVQRLELTVRDRLEWRYLVRKRPLAWVGAFLALGVLLGTR